MSSSSSNGVKVFDVIAFIITVASGLASWTAKANDNHALFITFLVIAILFGLYLLVKYLPDAFDDFDWD